MILGSQEDEQNKNITSLDGENSVQTMSASCVNKNLCVGEKRKPRCRQRLGEIERECPVELPYKVCLLGESKNCEEASGPLKDY